MHSRKETFTLFSSKNNHCSNRLIDKTILSLLKTVEDRKRVLWSDETKINRIGSDGKVYTWKEKGTPLSDRTTTPTVKHQGGNNLMVWGCIGCNGVGKLTEVEGKMDAVQHCKILKDGVVESFEKLEVEEEERIFQQDNDPKHTSKKATKWFENNDIQAWPAQSPDLNPIKHLWVHLKKRLREYPTPPKGVYELWERVAEEWDQITPETCQILINSMPRRVQVVIKAKGGHQSINLNYNRGSKNCPNKSPVCLIHYTINSHQNFMIKGLFSSYYIEV